MEQFYDFCDYVKDHANCYKKAFRKMPWAFITGFMDEIGGFLIITALCMIDSNKFQIPATILATGLAFIACAAAIKSKMGIKAIYTLSDYEAEIKRRQAEKLVKKARRARRIGKAA